MEFKPHNYQRAMFDFALQKGFAGLFIAPGMGKTVIALSVINELRYNRWSVSRALVIAPKKVAEATWGAEAAKWGHLKDLKVVTVLGSKTQRVRALNTPADVYVISRDSVAWLVEYYRQAWPFDYVVCDESTSIKNPQSKRFKALKLVRRFWRGALLLTGTPSSRGLMDLWAQVYLLDEGERLGKTIGQYRARYFTENTHGGHFTDYKPKSDAEGAVLGAIKDICVSMKAEDYLELPECVEHVIPVVLDSRARAAYDRFERDLLLDVGADTLTAQSAAVLTGKLLQFCNGAVYGEDKRAVRVHDCKLEALAELLESLNGESAVVFYGFRHDLPAIQERTGALGLRTRVYSGARDADDWNAGGIDVLLAHPASCAYGLNLQAGGRHVIWFGLNWSFELNDQGKCRLWRQGSKYGSIFVHFLVARDSVDDCVMAALQGRRSAHDAVMSALKARIGKINAGARKQAKEGLADEAISFKGVLP